MSNYQTEVQNLDNLASELSDLKKRLEQEIPKAGTHPPLWNGELQDLKNFTTELREWLDEPKLKQVKDIIREFQGICDDKREFRFDENKSYYISILDVLRQGKGILRDINNNDIEKEAARVILDQVFQQKREGELKVEINKIKEFWDKFNEKIADFDTKNDAFIEEVKKDSIENLVKSLRTGFNGDEVNNAYLKIEKADTSRESLREIESNAFLNEYEKNKNIDEIWSISYAIRKKLDNTNVDITAIPENTNRKIFSELLGYIKSRDDMLNEADLTKIKSKLDGLFGQLRSWSEKVNGFIKNDITQLDSWLTAIKNSGASQEGIQKLITEVTDLKQKLGSLRFSNVTEIKTKELYDAFEKYYALKKEIEDFFKHLMSEDARKVLNNLSNLEKIRIDMGDNFWKATKELCDAFPRLKIKIEWGEGQ